MQCMSGLNLARVETNDAYRLIVSVFSLSVPKKKSFLRIVIQDLGSGAACQSHGRERYLRRMGWDVCFINQGGP